ncbi:MAG TPA: protein kinase, partial [Ktedonosporobacter sp.]|nr:protein kinase [Ktedonosporobacter sp.]
MPDRVGQQIGNYHLLGLLGQGGFADVYLGEHLHLKSQAAIKILHTRLTEDLQDSFLNEARILAHLSHPHIIRVLDCGLDEGIPYLVMDYAPKGTLRQRHPRNTRLSVETVVEYVRQIVDGLQYAHNQKLIHRDLKPDNVLIGARDNLFLSDFGIALIAQTTRSRNAEVNLAGTASYMAPEQLQGKPQFASDQYALAIMVYEWLCGTRPFQGSLIELYSQHYSVPPMPLREHVPHLSLAIEQVVLRALAKDPAQRFPSVTDFAQALQQASQSAQSPFAQTILTPPPLSSALQSNPVLPAPTASDFSTYPPAPSQKQPSISTSQGHPLTPISAPSQDHLPTLVSSSTQGQIPTPPPPPSQEPTTATQIATPSSTSPALYPASSQAHLPALQAPWSPQASVPHITWPSLIAARASHLRSKLSPITLLLLAGLAILVILGASVTSFYAFNTRALAGSTTSTTTLGQTGEGNANSQGTMGTPDGFMTTPTVTPYSTSQPSPTAGVVSVVKPGQTPTTSTTSIPTPVPPTPTPVPPTNTPVPPT